MQVLSIVLTILGLSLFEIISSIDNAIINAEVLSKMGHKARRWFLTWGILFAVFVVRGLLPLVIVWFLNSNLNPIEIFTMLFSNDPRVANSMAQSAPILFMGGGVFLLFLFLHWIFLEEKNFGLHIEKKFQKWSVWFYAVSSVLLCIIVWKALKISPTIAFGAVVGSTAFFITHGFKQNAEAQEEKIVSSNSGLSDISKILYLEVIDMTFSIDGVLGAFAFTLLVPLILIGNGLGAMVVREITISNVDNIKKYAYLKNGAMYSILFLGICMILDGFGMHIPEWLSPVITFMVVGFFFMKSKIELKKSGN